MKRAAVPALLLVLATTACSDDPPAGTERDPDRIVVAPAEEGTDGGAGHTHAPGESDALPVGDGTRAAAGGYRLVDVRLPTRLGAPGDLSFRIMGPDGRPVTDYVEEQTKLLHLYVVRRDLTGFRHLHPVLADDGTWSTGVDLGEPGSYRVITEFTPGGGDTERPVLLGAEVGVGGAWEPEPVPTGAAAGTSDDGVVEARVTTPGTVSPEGRLQLVVSSLDGERLDLGSYLGAAAHLTGFETSTGQVVHVHPYGAPEPVDDGTELTFHTTFEEAGEYRFFLQVRVDGFLHTVPVTATVTG